ncbi:dihydrofolate reductase [Stutzerimonas tarimensis]|uniref:Dihydrofolate reductase n=1 Tax=Stutzerimonas tarimensis TaxID=1507735 RepID=A0ABV7T3Z4_9GAMM
MTTTPVSLALIVAVAENAVIGADNRMPWHLPAELQYFKSVTLGKPVIMGRKTWDSLGRPLPGRLNLVVSRQPELRLDGAEVFSDLGAARRRAERWAREQGAAEVMVIGGAQLFAETLDQADRLYLTRVALRPHGDVYFPEWDERQWSLATRHEHAARDGRPAYSCEVWERASSAA